MFLPVSFAIVEWRGRINLTVVQLSILSTKIISLKQPMILPIFGSPGSGKITLGNSLRDKCGYPFFELSWMPEFRTLNGRTISYEQDEKIAVCALVKVAQTYCEHGHEVVLVSDFRINSFDLVMSYLGFTSPVIKLIASDENILRSRVLNDSRPSVIFIAKLNETIIGTAQFVSSHRDRELANGKVTAYLQALDVKLQYRRQGIGTSIITSVELEALFKDFERLSVIVEPDNNPALNLYQKLDFIKFKRSTDCWQGKEYPVICLIKNIVY